ncbi:MAG: hypothetical protein HYW45_04055 [Candidatus Daviesbacteria bacterium]|nr:MAG: hypothetical protein HYW45_04055 [Candidatus Daviesbacteria bacterium]
MVNLKLALSAAVLLLTIVPTVLAQTSTSSSTPKKETLKERFETRKATLQERLDQRKENIASRTAALKSRLAKFKDQKRAQRVEKFNENLNKINENRTNAFLRFINTMSDILAKVETRVGNASGDTTAAQAAIADAKAKIAEAKIAVENQSAKDYNVNVTTEGKVKTNAKAAFDSLRQDLQATKTTLTETKQAVAKAIQTAASTLGENNGQ